jgi:hypothetical protein
MKPVLFPFTYMRVPDLKHCGRFFRGLKVFQFSHKYMPPEMQSLFDTDLVESVMPDPPTRLSFETALAETENWARSHRLGAASYAKGYKDRIPFFDASSVSQIRQDIRRANPQDPLADADENETMAAYIFLHMAQSFDIQNRTIIEQLRQQVSMEKSLYEALRGDEPFTHMDGIENFEDPAEYMLLDRLKAWSRVWMTSSDSQDLFVTTHPAVIALIQEHFSENEDFVPVATVPAIDPKARTANAQYRDLGAFCRKLASSDQARFKENGLPARYTPSPTASGCLQIYLLPELTPVQLFGHFAERANSIAPPSDNGADVVNTVIGLIETPRL